MKKKNLLVVSMALLLACAPTLTACEEALSDALVAVLTGFEKAPDPTIKEGRFNFSVTYELDGQVETISSVYVCKFAESGVFLDGWYIQWDSYVEDSAIQAQIDENYSGAIIVKEVEDGTIYLDLNLFAGYFMSQPGGYGRVVGVPYLFIKYNDAVAEETGVYGEEEDLAILESYGAKIISYEYDAPLENVYK